MNLRSAILREGVRKLHIPCCQLSQAILPTPLVRVRIANLQCIQLHVSIPVCKSFYQSRHSIFRPEIPNPAEVSSSRSRDGNPNAVPPPTKPRKHSREVFHTLTPQRQPYRKHPKTAQTVSITVSPLSRTDILETETEGGSWIRHQGYKSE